MFQREVDVRVYACPDCGNKLAKERDLLHCESHGAFFIYGPLLVRSPRENAQHRDTLLPWENHKTVGAR